MDKPFVLDKASILERLGGDEEIYAMMADMFLEDVDNYCASLMQPLQAGDAPLLQREAHTIKGLLASFSDEAGAQLAYAIENQAKQGTIAGIAGQIEALQARVREVAAALKAG